MENSASAAGRACWFFLAAPVVAVAAYLTIPLLIPVLTTYRLPLGCMGDILGGFLLALASFVVATAALSGALKAVAIPLVLRRLRDRVPSDRDLRLRHPAVRSRAPVRRPRALRQVAAPRVTGPARLGGQVPSGPA